MSPIMMISSRWFRAVMILALIAVCPGVRTLAAEAAEDESTLEIPDSGVGTAVLDHVLQGRATSFPEGTKVFFCTRVTGGRDVDRIRHVWIHDGKELAIGLAIGGSHWRTYSTKTLWPGSVGLWSVEARDSQNRVLARQEFRCTPANGG